jgi:hypothetical protein
MDLVSAIIFGYTAPAVLFFTISAFKEIRDYISENCGSKPEEDTL